MLKNIKYIFFRNVWLVWNGKKTKQKIVKYKINLFVNMKYGKYTANKSNNRHKTEPGLPLHICVGTNLWISGQRVSLLSDLHKLHYPLDYLAGTLFQNLKIHWKWHSHLKKRPLKGVFWQAQNQFVEAWLLYKLVISILKLPNFHKISNFLSHVLYPHVICFYTCISIKS